MAAYSGRAVAAYSGRAVAAYSAIESHGVMVNRERPDSRFLVGSRLLGVDYGDKRIGLAISDPSGTIASPAGFIQRRAGKRPPIAEIIRRAAALQASGFVVGLPLDGEGEETVRSREARHVAAELEKRTGLPARLVDERYTTSAALRAVREMGGTTRGRKGDVDALAATILLQHALSLEASPSNREDEEPSDVSRKVEGPSEDAG